METFQNNFSQKEYFNKSDKYYLHDNYNQFIVWVKNNVKIDPTLVLPLFPLEKGYISEVENDKKLASAMKKFVLANKRFFSTKSAQWHLFLQKECSPQRIIKSKRFFNNLIHIDFSKDFKFVIEKVSFESTKGLNLSLKFLDSKLFNLQTSQVKKKLITNVADKILQEDLSWSSIPNFIKKEPLFLIRISRHAAVVLKENEFDEYINIIRKNKLNGNLEFLSLLKDDGYLALTLGDKNLQKNYNFWLLVAKQYRSSEREQSDYEDYFWKFVPQYIKCNKRFVSSLKRIIPDFKIT
ncbi:MAG: hypothetical protein ACKO7P_07090 [Bacteroidota bacterium]